MLARVVPSVLTREYFMYFLGGELEELAAAGWGKGEEHWMENHLKYTSDHHIALKLGNGSTVCSYSHPELYSSFGYIF